MQEKNRPGRRRTNADRSAAMRDRLLTAARTLFADQGYAETSTPEIVRAADVTRGALYHHFPDKAALFAAVVTAEAAAVAAEIEARAGAAATPVAALLAGAEAYFDAMAAPGRARLLLLDGPAVLGPEAMTDIDGKSGGGSLKAGLAAAGIAGVDPDALGEILSAGFDRAALHIAAGADPAPYLSAFEKLLTGVVGR